MSTDLQIKKNSLIRSNSEYAAYLRLSAAIINSASEDHKKAIKHFIKTGKGYESIIAEERFFSTKWYDDLSLGIGCGDVIIARDRKEVVKNIIGKYVSLVKKYKKHKNDNAEDWQECYLEMLRYEGMLLHGGFNAISVPLGLGTAYEDIVMVRKGGNKNV